MLYQELKALEEEDFNLSIIGFSDDELERRYDATITEELKDEDDIPALPKQPISRTGDLWVWADHKLLAGDVTNRQDVTRLKKSTIVNRKKHYKKLQNIAHLVEDRRKCSSESVIPLRKCC